MSRLKIGIVVDRVMPHYIGGYERRYWELARRLVQNNEVHIYTSCDKSEIIEGIHFHKIAPKLPYFNNKGYRLLNQDFYFTVKYLQQFEKLDVIDCNATPFFHIPIISLFMKLKRTKLTITVHEVLQKTVNMYLQYRYSNSFKEKLIPLISGLGSQVVKLSLKVPRPDLIIAVSETTENMLKKIGLEGSTIMIPNGVRNSFFKENKNKNRNNDVVFVGRLSPEKRIGDLLKSLSYFRDLNKSTPSTQIIGNGPDMSNLVKQSKNLDLTKSVDFRGYLGEKEMENTLKDSKVFVLPSAREGFSIATAEAMACQLPIVMAVPAIPEEVGGGLGLVTNGVNGFNYPAGNIAELTDRLTRLLNNEIMRIILGKRSFQKAKNYNWDVIAKSYEKKLTELVDNKILKKSTKGFDDNA